MFNFWVILAGLDRCRWKFEALWLQRKSTKNEETFENMNFSKKQFEDFQWRKNKLLA